MPSLALILRIAMPSSLGRDGNEQNPAIERTTAGHTYFSQTIILRIQIRARSEYAWWTAISLY